MSNARSLALLGVPLALLGAFCAGAILAPFAAPPADPSAPSALAREASPAAAPSGLSSASERFERREERAPALSSGELGAERVRALAASFDAEFRREEAAADPVAPSETFAVEGRVATPSGEPVARAVIRTIPAMLRFNGWEEEFLQRRNDGRPEERSLERTLRAAAKRHAEIQRDLRSAQSDAEGTFRLSGLRAGIGHTLEAFCAGYEITSIDGSPFPELSPGQNIQLLAKPLVRVPLRVEEGDGKPLEIALVHVESTGQHGWSMPRAWRREEGAIFLARGTYRLHASHVPARGLGTEPVQLEVDPAAPPQELLLRFRNLARLELRVAGKALEGPERRSIHVRVAEHENGQAPTREEMRWSGRKAESSGSGSPALFVARDLEAGPHTVAVLFGETRVLALQTLEIAAGVNTLELTLEERRDDRIVELRAADPEGRGIPDLQVWVQREAEDAADDQGVVVVPMDEVGVLWHLVHAAERLGPAVKWRLRATSPRHGQIAREYDPSSAEKIELRFAEGARLEAELPQARGAQLVVERPPRPERPAEPEQVAQCEFDEGGRALLGPLAPGRYLVRVELRFHRWNSISVLQREIELVPGANRVELALPPLYSVQLSALGPEASTGTVYLSHRSSEGRESAFTVPLEEGRAQLENLPAGRYDAYVQLPKESSVRRVEFSLPGAAELVFPEPSRATAAPGLALDKIDPSSRAGQLGLQPGDVLVGIAGRSLEDPETAWAILLAAPHFLEGESYALEVQRGGQRLELNLPRELLLDPVGNGIVLRGK
ncbi:MAG: hypothetical protein IPN34_04215 [Planctomycetes bacterium]|nr:hypothetical protein [Planctomycetota bacterium]